MSSSSTTVSFLLPFWLFIILLLLKIISIQFENYKQQWKHILILLQIFSINFLRYFDVLKKSQFTWQFCFDRVWSLSLLSTISNLIHTKEISLKLSFRTFLMQKFSSYVLLQWIYHLNCQLFICSKGIKYFFLFLFLSFSHYLDDDDEWEIKLSFMRDNDYCLVFYIVCEKGLKS